MNLFLAPVIERSHLFQLRLVCQIAQCFYCIVYFVCNNLLAIFWSVRLYSQSFLTPNNLLYSNFSYSASDAKLTTQLALAYLEYLTESGLAPD